MVNEAAAALGPTTQIPGGAAELDSAAWAAAVEAPGGPERLLPSLQLRRERRRVRKAQRLPRLDWSCRVEDERRSLELVRHVRGARVVEEPREPALVARG